MTDQEIIKKNISDLKALDTLSRSRGWKVLTQILKDDRKRKSEHLLMGLGQSEKIYTTDDLIKSKIKMINWLVDAPEALTQAIKNENEKIGEPSEYESMEVGDVDDIYNDMEA